MNRIRKKSAPYDLMAIFESLGVEKGLSIVQPAGTEQLLADVRSALDAARHNPIMVHGRRVQSMFSFVVSSLGSAALVKDEDSGETYTTDAAIKVPDCFVALKDGRSFLVEVKNNHHGPQKPYRITNSYLDALTRYATLVQRPLRFAIYWSKANIWTLISADRLPPSVDGKVLLDFGTAMKRNEMADLGDAQLGTTPPLALRVAFHAPMQRALEEPGHFQLVISDIRLTCAGKIIERELERHLAIFFMFYGEWRDREQVVTMEGEKILAVEFPIAPADDELALKQGFDFVGSLSGMISRHYHALTSADGKIRQLIPRAEPGTLGIVIPDDYKGEHLPLWRFHQVPNYEQNSAG